MQKLQKNCFLEFRLNIHKHHPNILHVWMRIHTFIVLDVEVLITPASVWVEVIHKGSRVGGGRIYRAYVVYQRLI